MLLVRVADMLEVEWWRYGLLSLSAIDCATSAYRNLSGKRKATHSRPQNQSRSALATVARPHECHIRKSCRATATPFAKIASGCRITSYASSSRYSVVHACWAPIAILVFLELVERREGSVHRGQHCCATLSARRTSFASSVRSPLHSRSGRTVQVRARLRPFVVGNGLLPLFTATRVPGLSCDAELDPVECHVPAHEKSAIEKAMW